MDELTRQRHLAAGRRAGEEATCGPPQRRKVDYKREESAVKAADSLNRRGDRRNTLEGYPCPWCLGWHVGRKMSAEELAGG